MKSTNIRNVLFDERIDIASIEKMENPLSLVFTT